MNLLSNLSKNRLDERINQMMQEKDEQNYDALFAGQLQMELSSNRTAINKWLVRQPSNGRAYDQFEN